MPRTFFQKWILEPIADSLHALRHVGKAMGIVDPLDKLIIESFEDPLFHAILTKLYDFTVFNDEVIPKEGPVLIATNHQSLLDPVIMGLAIMHNSRRLPYQLAKAEYAQNPMLSIFTRMNRAIYIRRGDSDVNALDKVKEALDGGEIVIFYPEGSMGKGNGEFLPFKSGITRMAYDMGVPIIPVGHFGSDAIYGQGAKMPRNKGFLRVKFGNPLVPEKLFKNYNREEIASGKSTATPNFEKATKKVQRAVKKLWTDLWMDAEEAKKTKKKSE